MTNRTNHLVSRRSAMSITAMSITAGSTLALAGCGRGPGDEAPAFVPSAPLSSFDKTSTAEQVAAGIDMTGKSVMITGCNSGLGFESMRVLAMHGAHILGTARSKDKAAEAWDQVKAQAPKAKFTPLACELTDFANVAACADQVKAMNIPLDVLMCNAGIMALQQNEQVNGIEKHFVVNHLSHFVLVNRLLDAVKAAPQGRIVSVSSLGYRWAPATGIEFDNLAGTRDYTPNKMYGQSKMANHLMVRELAKRLAGTTTTANSIHPGVINTNLGRHYPWYVKTLAGLIGWTFMKSPEGGAATQVYVATAPALSKVSGLYFEDCNPVVPTRPEMENAELAAKLWAVSEELTKPYLATV